MQRTSVVLTLRMVTVFQSSPALSGRCNQGIREGIRGEKTWFQSSPALSGRCNETYDRVELYLLSVSILTGPFGPVQRMTAMARANEMEFQSSPALSGRCNDFNRAILAIARQVSILTGPFGPVQRPA